MPIEKRIGYAPIAQPGIASARGIVIAGKVVCPGGLRTAPTSPSVFRGELDA
jgi:hypothetical protein